MAPREEAYAAEDYRYFCKLQQAVKNRQSLRLVKADEIERGQHDRPYLER